VSQEEKKTEKTKIMFIEERTEKQKQKQKKRYE
jgi:hypothetical protein